MIYEQRGDLVRASRQAEAALALDPLNPVATYNANNFLMARGENAKVRERLLPLTGRPDPPPIVFMQLVENAFASGDRDEALRWTGDLAAHGGQSRGTQLFVATALARLGRIEEARAALAAADQTRAADTGESLDLALWAHQLLEGKAGTRAYLADQRGLRASTAHHDTSEETRHWLEVQGLGHVLAGEPALAVPLLEKVFGTDGMPLVRLQPVDVEADFANALAWAYRETANATRAREVAEGTLVSLDSVASTGFDKNPRLMLDRALALDLAGQRDRARAAFEAALARGGTQRVELATDPRWRSLVDAASGRFAALPRR
jgi:tetratricopeptide (TPR) repeat protein